MPQPVLLTALSAASIAFSGWLTEDKLPKWSKSLIAAFAVFLAALVYAAFAGQLTGNFTVDVAAIAALIGWLMVGPLEPLHTWMVTNCPGPLDTIVEDLTPVPIRPAAISSRPSPNPRVSLPTTPSLIERTSLLDNDPTWRPTVAGLVPPDAMPLQVPSVDPGHIIASQAPAASTEPAHDQGATTNPMPAVQAPSSQPGNGTETGQSDQSMPPPPYGP